MKKLPLIILLLLPLMASAVDKKKKKPLLGRWREISRMTADSSAVVPVPAGDTLFVTFQRGDSFMYRNGNGFVYIGKYTLSEDSLLDFGTNRFQIRRRKPTSLMLSNNSGIYNMVPDWSDTAEVIVLAKEDSLLPVKDIDQMIGRWAVYKRTSEGEATLDGDNIIRSVYITGPSSDGKQGFVFSSKDPQNMPSWYIKGLGTDQVLTAEGKNNKTLKVIKCQKGEMILEDNGVKYYFKQSR